MDTLDELYARWQRNPNVSQTVALCHALRGSARGDLVEIVGSHASRQLDLTALIAAAQMYAAGGRFDDAQEVLLAAGRLAPRDGDVYRWLGEVLLRRGDAERAEKVFERAMQFGAKDPSVDAWLGRARALLNIQRESGMMGVAAEIARTEGSSSRGPAADPVPDEIETAIRKEKDLRAHVDAVKRAPAAGRPPPPLAPPRAPNAPPARAPSFSSLKTIAGGVGLDMPQTTNIGAPPGHDGALAFAGTEPFSSPAAPPQRPPPSPFAAPEPARPELPLYQPPPRPRNPSSPDSAHVPEPRDVLEALQTAGIFEPQTAGGPQAITWATPEKGKRRIGAIVALGVLAAALVGGGIGTNFYIRDKRAKQHVQAEALLAKVDATLHAGDVAALDGAEKELGSVFELESRSPHAALSWLQERAMTGLLKGGENLAFEDATERARDVGVDPKTFAFASVAAFLFQGDTAGAAAAVAKSDSIAQGDAYFQLLAGATFDRAGDARALERYAAATKLDPELFIAKVLLARANAVEGDPRVAAEIGKELKSKYPLRVEGAALIALAWARDPFRGDPPPEVKEMLDRGNVLPASLRAVPHAVRAVTALEQHKLDEAKPHLQKGLAVADTPGIASWLGSIALSTGDEQLARKAALSAVSFSAVYPPARMLAARVALLGARLDEALKAAEDLPPGSPDVAIVTATVSYEKVDGERMSRGLDALSDDAKKLPFLSPLFRGQALLAGNAGALSAEKAISMANDDAPWGDLVAMDFALDVGDLVTADKIAATWKGEPRPLRALRLARLARYQGKNEDAERLSRVALEGSTVTVRVLSERVYALVAAGKAHDAVALFKVYPNVGGSLAKWLRAYAIASNGRVDEARALLSSEEPPPALAPLPARIIAAAAYGATKDARHGNEYVRAIAHAGFANPDVATASEKLGGGRVVVRRGR